MKKLLTVSLVAVMAVSAAHAQIASTEYVGKQIADFNTNTVTPLNTKVGDAQFTKGVAVDHKGNVTAAIDAVAAAVAGLSGEGGEVAGALAEAKSYADSAASTAKSEAISAAALDAKSKADTAESNAKTFTTTELQKLNLTQVGEEGSFIELVSETNGQVSASAKGFAATVAENGTIAPTAGAVYTAVEGAKSTAKSYTDSQISNITDNVIGAQESRLSTVEGAIEGIMDEEGGILAQAGADAKSKADTAESNAKTFTTTELQKLNLTQVGEEGSFIELVSETNGQVSASAKGFAATVAENGTIAPTAGAVYTAVEGAKSAATTAAKTYTDTQISNLTALDKVPTECRGATTRCALIAVGGKLEWEVVEY